VQHFLDLLNRRADLRALTFAQQLVPRHRLAAEARVQLQHREIRVPVLAAGRQQDLLDRADGLEPETRVAMH